MLQKQEICRLKDTASSNYKRETITVKAADGITDLYGVMWKPSDFDSTRVYPIVTYVNPVPFAGNTPLDVDGSTKYCENLANLGIIVVQIGYRGDRALRGLNYQLADRYGSGDVALADQKSALKELCGRYPFIDRNKVGILGISSGGALAAAMFKEPDFFKVGVCVSGIYDNNIYNRKITKRYLEPCDGKKYSMLFDCVSGLKGKMLLVTGSQDTDVHPAHTYRLIEALEGADKKFDFLELPSQKDIRFLTMEKGILRDRC